MTEFTSEFIAEQRKLIVALPKHLSVGDVQKNHVNINQNFDTKPIPTTLNIMDVNIFSTMSETCLTAQSICDACNNYPDALDHIERLQQRIAELEAHNKDFHLACINALDLHRESDVPKLKDIPNIIEEIRERNQKLEIQLKSKDIIINNQQGRLNYYATKDLFRGNNEHG